ncbi:hypothetical protein BC829DRAFT_435387 [Chytridium lagenaria]|nr:hypothetical protein BC829DRAFT_435387 [Chytridium lagenaria]
MTASYKRGLLVAFIAIFTTLFSLFLTSANALPVENGLSRRSYSHKEAAIIADVADLFAEAVQNALQEDAMSADDLTDDDITADDLETDEIRAEPAFGGANGARFDKATGNIPAGTAISNHCAARQLERGITEAEVNSALGGSRIAYDSVEQSYMYAYGRPNGEVVAVSVKPVELAHPP